MKWYSWVGIIFLVVLFFSWISNAGQQNYNNNISKPTHIQTYKLKPTSTPYPTPDPCSMELIVITDFKEFHRNATKVYQRKALNFSGIVSQVLPKERGGYDYVIRDGERSKIYSASSKNTILKQKIMEGDTILFCGKFIKLVQTETVLGAPVEMPAVEMLRVLR